MAKKKHKPKPPPAPPLCAVDHTLYLLGFLLGAAGFLTPWILVLVIRRRVACSVPHVIGYASRASVYLGVPLGIWGITIICIVCSFYRRRVPLWGNPHIYYRHTQTPWLRDNGPWQWRSQKELAYFRKSRRLYFILTAAALSLCLFFASMSVCGRTCLLDDGSASVYSVWNNETASWRSTEIRSAEIRPVSTSRPAGLHLELLLRTEDGKRLTFSFPISPDRDDTFRELLTLRERYGERWQSEDWDRLAEYLADHSYPDSTRQLLYALFHG